MKCRNCNTRLDKVINFGKMPLANGFLKKRNFKDEFFFKLETAFCKKCYLFQLTEFPKPKQMFNSKYPFHSHSSKSMQTHFNKFFSFTKKFIKKNSKILEIGCNDGILLKNYKSYNHLGVEPSKNVAKLAKEKFNLNVINDFFNLELVKNKNLSNKYDLVISANVICHIPNINELAKSVSSVLKDGGTFVFEEPYLGDVVKKISYDQIYDEHIFLFSLNSVKNIFSKFGLELIDFQKQSTHGGSMRYILKKRPKVSSKKVIKGLRNEKKIGLCSLKKMKQFKKDCEKQKKFFLDVLKKNREKYGKISAYGATSKSTTILNFCNVGTNYIDCIYDTTIDKIDKFSPGKHIPIKNYNEFVFKNHKVMVLFAWNHIKEIKKKELKYIRNGGKFIFHSSKI